MLSIILTFCGYVAGLAHAIWVCDGMKFEGGDDDFTPFGF
ncbi:MAG: YqaE/Pmp3 family membrane protein [Candidatus Delongbacteria bacterium]|nr:YqaE/Pmp3 family membrane protein [Candidatus Delongbacteria bacterium]MBN2834792.1 YqaE/Pmp3 family membrane protein [Candidatus Delongbacteria bacterium]